MDYRKSDLIILMTATVNTNGMMYTKLTNVDMRKCQYLEALNYYLSSTKAKIVFVENSGCDLSKDFTCYIKEGRLEMLCYDGNRYPRTRGKGYGEAMILNYALKHSRIINRNSLVLKITGRLICHNINKLFYYCKNPKTIYAERLKTKSMGIYLDSRVFVCPVSFLEEYFLPNISKLDDSKHYFFEHLLYSTSIDWIDRGGRFKEFVFPLKIKGSSGTSNNPYPESKISFLSFYIHYFLHKLGYYGPIRFSIKQLFKMKG